MKTGKTLVELAQEIERQRETRVDYVAPTEKVQIAADGSDVFMDLLGKQSHLAMNDLAHRQIGDHAQIPAKYYDRMRTAAPTLLADNLNHWLHAAPSKQMIRTLDGRVRAFLSDRYRPLENADFAEVLIPALMNLDVEIISCEITEKRLYIKAVDKRINRDIPSGRRMGDGSHTIFDTVSPAIIASNSEVGEGALKVETGVWTRACTNLAVFKQSSLRKYHVGGRHEITEGLVHMLSDETRQQSDKATWMQVRDVVAGAFDQAQFDARIAAMKGMTEVELGDDVAEVVELTGKHFGMAEGERKGVLANLIKGGDLTKYGLFNAITRTAEDLPNYDRATEFERIGGELIELAANDFTRLLAKAA